MGWMSEIDIMRREGAREVEDFEGYGYSRSTSKIMSEIVKGAEEATAQEFKKVQE